MDDQIPVESTAAQKLGAPQNEAEVRQRIAVLARLCARLAANPRYTPRTDRRPETHQHDEPPQA
jgi:hypothetical protein